MPNSNVRELENSERTPVPGAQVIGVYPQDEQIEVTIRLKSEPSADFHSKVLPAGKLGALPLQERTYLNRTEFEKCYEASSSDINAVTQFAESFGLIEVGSCGAGRLLRFTGSVAEMESAFEITLLRYSYRFGEYRGYVGKLKVPVAVWGSIEGVFGLDTRKQSKPILATTSKMPLQGNSQSVLQHLIECYQFPQGWNGGGETIGILEFGGQFLLQDYAAYFQQTNLGSPLPLEVGTVPQATTPRDDLEVALDVEVAGTVAPGAQTVVYFAPNTDKGWVDGLCAAVYDKKNNPTILSISWGKTEDGWGEDTRDVVNQILMEAAQLGVTVCAASGDDGCALNKNGEARVIFPASSPYVLSCGGTAFRKDKGEVVWNDGARSATGGGESTVAPRPDWQKTLLPKQPQIGRLLPDVAGLAARRYSIYSRGGYVNGVGGTSAVAPLWAGLIACMNQDLQRRPIPSRVGYFNPLLYNTPALQKTFNDIVFGNNGLNGNVGFQATAGWDECTGWGTPKGQALLNAL
ncbi:MAG TPA: S53 family peptidase [Candidatus Angelobacter sp.]